jgi:hypothetical protein
MGAEGLRQQELAELGEKIGHLIRVAARLPEWDSRRITAGRGRELLAVVAGLPQISAGLAVFWADLHHSSVCLDVCIASGWRSEAREQLGQPGSAARQELRELFRTLPEDSQHCLAGELAKLLEVAPQLAWELVQAEHLSRVQPPQLDEDNSYMLGALREMASEQRNQPLAVVCERLFEFARTGTGLDRHWVGLVMKELSTLSPAADVTGTIASGPQRLL